ncbi:hypothetical protein BT93_K1163 [Corymbia citriodora subsp. variegata]|nr:hypothetical protein BT93_K1163 [Corymbia citriodora subsp. variegata]
MVAAYLESQDELHCVAAEGAVHKTYYLFMRLNRQGRAWRKTANIAFSSNK